MARILVVDDEVSIREIGRKLLALHGHTVDTAADGEEAIDQLERKTYDLLILDNYMPKLSGVQVSGIIRTIPKFKKMKIMMLTSMSVTKDVDEAFEAGIDGYITKPFSMKHLIEKVERTLLGAR
jgi:DNA-binding response OmpR family regulator